MSRTIQISDTLFWGFKEEIPLNQFRNFDELCEYMKNSLIKFLRINNLLNLVDKAKELKLHNHQYKLYEQLYRTHEDTVIYLCGSECK